MMLCCSGTGTGEGTSCGSRRGEAAIQLLICRFGSFIYRRFCLDVSQVKTVQGRGLQNAIGCLFVQVILRRAGW